MKLSIFFNTDYVDQASYDNIRKISSYIDGQKNASRKVLYTVLEKNIKEELKVYQLNSKMSEFADYLHGSAENVIVNLAQNFLGTNNIQLLADEGNFGTRFNPEASASRYIFTCAHDNLWKLFNKEDNAVLIQQTFEGEKIEPKFYVPLLPLVLINGSEGITSGFAQKILNRNPQCIKTYILDKLNGSLKPNKNNSLTPYYKWFTGSIDSGENSKQWLIKGSYEVISATKIRITEVPVGEKLKTYLNTLRNLKESGYISSFEDKSENDRFEFIVTSKNFSTDDRDTILSKLKLIKKVSENFTCINEDNRIECFESAQEIIERFIDIKLQYTEKRRLYIIDKILTELKFLKSKYIFVKSVIEESIVISKKTKKEISEQLGSIKEIIQKDESYDYLLNMPIHSISEETFQKLIQELKNKKQQLEEYKKITASEIYKKELEELQL